MFKKLIDIRHKLNPALNKIVSNTIWLFADKVIQTGLSFFVGVWVARYLGPEQFGILNYAASFVALLSPLAGLGLNGIVVRDIAKNPSSKNATLGTGFFLLLASGTLTFLLSIVLILHLKADSILTQWVVGILAAGTLFQAFNTVDLWFQSQTQSKYTVLAKRSAYIILTLTRIVLIQLHAPLIAFAWARLAEIALAAVGLVAIYHQQGGQIKDWKFSLDRARMMLRDSWPLIIAGLSTYIYAGIDQVMLGQMATLKSVGTYSVAVRLSEFWDFIPMVLAQSTLPTLARKYEESEESFLSSLQKFFDLMALSWFGIAVVVSVLSPWIIATLYGTAYKGSATILSIYVWGQFGSNFGVARSLYMNVKNILKLSLVISIGGAMLNVLLNLYLIPQYQEVGAALATLITYFFAVIFSNFIFRELRQLLPIIFKSLIIPQAFMRLVQSFRTTSS
ncbi:MAG: flippase [Phormidium sp.]